MPRANPPPTPASSTDIVAKSGSELSALGISFLLPPPAMAAADSQKNTIPSPQSPSMPAAADFSLPPPPTRSRKIIQMKPRSKGVEESTTSLTPKPKSAARRGSNVAQSAAAVPTKKQPSATSAAGRKMARKTAHSVIERRRRSKMNEEFGVLKTLVPACQGQEMHKLAILQATIDYLRYLEQCIVDLQTVNSSKTNHSTEASVELGGLPLLRPSLTPVNDEDESDSDEDLEMGNTESTGTTSAFSAANTPMNPFKCPTSAQTSPALEPLAARPSSSYASSVSTLPSPAYEPQQKPYQEARLGYMLSASMSPILLPSTKDLDHEATSALLMLNKDRRHPNSGRGMSVKDLLSH